MVPEKIEKIKQRLKGIIKERCISYNELATMADISDTCIRNWFGKRNYIPRIDSLLKICEALGIDEYDLFVDAEDKNLYPLNKQEVILYNEWKSLNSKQKEALINFLKCFK